MVSSIIYLIMALVTVGLLYWIYKLGRKREQGITLLVMFVLCFITSMTGITMAQASNGVPRNLFWSLINSLTMFTGGGGSSFGGDDLLVSPQVMDYMNTWYQCTRLCTLFASLVAIISLFTGNLWDRLRNILRIRPYKKVVRVFFDDKSNTALIRSFVNSVQADELKQTDTLVSVDKTDYYASEESGLQNPNLIFQDSIAAREAKKANQMVTIRFKDDSVSVDTDLIEPDTGKGGKGDVDMIATHDVVRMDYDTLVARNYINTVFVPVQCRRIEAYPLKTVADLQMLQPVRVLIIGDLDGLGGQILRRVIMNSQMPYAAIPDIDFCSPRLDSTLGAFSNRYPTLLDYANVEYHGMDLGGSEFYALLDASAQTGSHYDYVVVATADKTVNLNIANEVHFHLTMLMGPSQVGGIEPMVRIAAFADDPQKTTPEKSENTVDVEDMKRISFFGQDAQLYSLDALQNSQIDRCARLINAFYCGVNIDSSTGDPDASPQVRKTWRECKQFDRNSSRASAEFINVEQHWKNRFEELGLSADDVKMRIVQLEHKRWCAFFATEGFRPMSYETLHARYAYAYAGNAEEINVDGGIKDVTVTPKNCMKFARADTPNYRFSHYEHICLVPWDELPEKDEECAKVQAEFKPRFFKDHAGEVKESDFQTFDFQKLDEIVLSLMAELEKADNNDNGANN